MLVVRSLVNTRSLVSIFRSTPNNISLKYKCPHNVVLDFSMFVLHKVQRGEVGYGIMIVGNLQEAQVVSILIDD